MLYKRGFKRSYGRSYEIDSVIDDVVDGHRGKVVCNEVIAGYKKDLKKDLKKDSKRDSRRDSKGKKVSISRGVLVGVLGRLSCCDSRNYNLLLYNLLLYSSSNSNRKNGKMKIRNLKKNYILNPEGFDFELYISEIDSSRYIMFV